MAGVMGESCLHCVDWGKNVSILSVTRAKYSGSPAQARAIPAKFPAGTKGEKRPVS